MSRYVVIGDAPTHSEGLFTCSIVDRSGERDTVVATVESVDAELALTRAHLVVEWYTLLDAQEAHVGETVTC